jgi:hypothetical protein
MITTCRRGRAGGGCGMGARWERGKKRGDKFAELGTGFAHKNAPSKNRPAEARFFSRDLSGGGARSSCRDAARAPALRALFFLPTRASGSMRMDSDLWIGPLDVDLSRAWSLGSLLWHHCSPPGRRLCAGALCHVRDRDRDCWPLDPRCCAGTFIFATGPTHPLETLDRTSHRHRPHLQPGILDQRTVGRWTRRR